MILPPPLVGEVLALPPNPSLPPRMSSSAPATRLSLNDAERFVLIKLCVLYGPEYPIPNGRLVFWTKIGELATEQLGKDPNGIMRRMQDYTFRTSDFPLSNMYEYWSTVSQPYR